MFQGPAPKHVFDRTPPMGLVLDGKRFREGLRKAGRMVRAVAKRMRIRQEAKQAPMIGEGL